MPIENATKIAVTFEREFPKFVVAFEKIAESMQPVEPPIDKEAITSLFKEAIEFGIVNYFNTEQNMVNTNMVNTKADKLWSKFTDLIKP